LSKILNREDKGRRHKPVDASHVVIHYNMGIRSPDSVIDTVPLSDFCHWSGLFCFKWLKTWKADLHTIWHTVVDYICWLCQNI